MGAPDRVGHLVGKFLKTFRPDQWWSLSYTLTCSKLRAGACGGGAVFVTASGVESFDADSFIDAKARAFESGGGPQALAKLVEQAEQGGLEEDTLDDCVHEAASAHAASVNNGGIARQIEYLVGELGPAKTERTLASLIVPRSSQPGEDP